MDAYIFCREHFSVKDDTIVITCEDDTFVKGRCDSFEKYIKAKFKRHFAKDVWFAMPPWQAAKKLATKLVAYKITA